MKTSKRLPPTISPLQSMHRLRHQQERGGGSSYSSRTRLLLYEVGDYIGMGRLCVRHTRCRRTHNLGNPSGKRGTQLLGSFHQMVCYGPQEASLLSVVLFVPRPLGIREPHQCLRGKGHELGCTSSYNSSALVG